MAQVSSNRKASDKLSVPRQSRQAANVKHLVAEFLDSSSPKKMGTLVLEHADDYDDDFFEVLAAQIARETADRDFHRVRVLEALRQYLRYVRQRVSTGQTADMWRELATGAAREEENLKQA